MVARAHGERLGDPPRLDAQRPGGGVDGRRAVLDFDQPQLRGVGGEPRADAFERSFADQVERDLPLRRAAAVLEQENALPGAKHMRPSWTGIDSWVCVSALRRCAGMSSGPSSSCS